MLSSVLAVIGNIPGWASATTATLNFLLEAYAVVFLGWVWGVFFVFFKVQLLLDMLHLQPAFLVMT